MKRLFYYDNRLRIVDITLSKSLFEIFLIIKQRLKFQKKEKNKNGIKKGYNDSSL